MVCPLVAVWNWQLRAVSLDGREGSGRPADCRAGFSDVRAQTKQQPGKAVAESATGDFLHLIPTAEPVPSQVLRSLADLMNCVYVKVGFANMTAPPDKLPEASHS